MLQQVLRQLFQRAISAFQELCKQRLAECRDSGEPRRLALDLRAMALPLAAFIDADIRNLIIATFDLLGVSEEDPDVDELARAFSRRLRLQLACFQDS